MPANFTLCMPFDKTHINSDEPVLDGDYLQTKDQAPTGSWLEVDFATGLALQAARNVRGALVHISTDVALRFRAATAEPAGGDLGQQILAGGERTIGLGGGKKLWIK